MRLYTFMDLGARIAIDLWWASWAAWLPQVQRGSPAANTKGEN